MAVRMTFCASWIRFVWTRTASFAFSDSVNVIPERRRLLTPLIGSSSAFPSWTALVVASPNPAAAMSTAAWVARSKASPAMSAVIASWRNVRSLAWAALMVSAMTPVSRSMESAKSEMRFVTTTVSPPNSPMVRAMATMRWSAMAAFSASFAHLAPTKIAALPIAPRARAPFFATALALLPKLLRSLDAPASAFRRGAAFPVTTTFIAFDITT